MSANGTDLKRSLHVLYLLVQHGDATIYQQVEQIRQLAREECDELLFLREGLQQVERPLEEKTSRKKFRALFKEACSTLPGNPLDSSRWASKTLTALSKLITMFSIMHQVQADVATCLRSKAGGTTNYHLRQFVQQLEKKEGDENTILFLSIQQFWNEQLLDAIQEPVHEILLVVERIESDELLAALLSKHKISLTNEEKKALNTLHRNLVIQLPLSPCISPLKLSPRIPEETPSHQALSPRTRMSERLISLSRKISTPRLRRGSSRDSPPRKTSMLTDRGDSIPLVERTVSAIGKVPHASDFQRGNENTPIPTSQSEDSLTICEAHGIEIRGPESTGPRSPMRRNLSLRHNRSRSINLTPSLSQSGVRMRLDLYSKSNPISRSEKEGNDSIQLRPRKSARNRPVSARLLQSLADSPPLLQRQKSMPRKRLAARCSGYWFEEGLPRDKEIEFYAPVDQTLRFADGSLPASEWFNTYFTEGSYRTYVSPMTLEGCAVLLSKKENGDRPHYRALYCSSTRTIGVVVSVPRSKILGKFNSLKHILKAIDPLLSSTPFTLAPNMRHDTLRELNLLELTTVFKKLTYKFGVLNWQEGNKSEEDMFSNRDLSPQFKEFLDVLGDTIELCDWKGYNGGLDTTQPGVRAVHTKMEETSVLYHVAPYLPYSANNEQQLHRKMHIGNDVAIIVFNEASQPYLTSMIASQFNHIIIVVAPEVGPSGNTEYSVVVTAKEGVPTFGPALPPRGIFHSKQELREFLLQKMINGEKAASCAPLFEKRLAKSRELLLRNLVESNSDSVE